MIFGFRLGKVRTLERKRERTGKRQRERQKRCTMDNVHTTQ